MVILERHRSAQFLAGAGYRRMLVPVTDGPEGELAVDLACRFASDRHALVVALAAIEIPLEQPLDVPAREQEAHAHELLERAHAIGASYGVRIVARKVRTRSAADAVLAEVVDGQIEIVVLGLAPLDQRKSLGRTIDFVLKHAPCRVMLASSPRDG